MKGVKQAVPYRTGREADTCRFLLSKVEKDVLTEQKLQDAHLAKMSSERKNVVISCHQSVPRRICRW